MGLRGTIRRAVRRWRGPSSSALGLSFEPFGWLLSRDPTGVPELSLSSAPVVDDARLVRRVMAAYSAAARQHTPSGSFWDTSIRNLNSDIHEALVGTNEAVATEKLRNPAENSHFWGFDAIAAAPSGKTEPHHAVLASLKRTGDWRRLYAIWLYDALTSLADALGARRLSYPEYAQREVYVAPDSLLDRIEEAVRTPLHFPNPYAGELGLATRRGVVGFRAIQSLYQGWRIAQFAKRRPDFRVLEIGAGLGRTAYFTHQFGVEDYTIIDIPMTGAAQGYFLGRALGEDKVRLFGETGPAPVSVRSASELDVLVESGEKTFDLIVNVDSLTEMSEEVIQRYWRYATRSARVILSINHEANQTAVRDLYAGDPSLSVERYPYWMRRGYVEEIIRVAD